MLVKSAGLIRASERTTLKCGTVGSAPLVRQKNKRVLGLDNALSVTE